MNTLQEFELHGETLAAAELRMDPATMRFLAPAAERDFLRFRNAGRVAIVMATFGIYAAAQAQRIFTTPALRDTSDGALVPTVIAAVRLIANVAALALEVVFVACRSPTAVAQQARRAARHERISAAGNLVSNVALAANMAHVVRATCSGLASREAYRDCAAGFDVAISLAVATVLIAPRFSYLVPMNAIVTVAYIIHINLSYALFEPIDYVADAVVLCGFMVALNVAAWTREARERAFFLKIVELHRAAAAIDGHRAAARAALATVLPASLLHGGAARGVAHHSTAATIAVSDIYGFAVWSTWHLEVDVVFILHALMTAYDELVEDHDGVERAMAYGDSYVVCCGLVEPRREHAAAVMQCALDMRAAARGGAIRASKLCTRTAVFSGELRGTTIGTAARRYAVTGPAFDEAVDLIGTCVRDEIVAGSYASVTDEAITDAPSGPDVHVADGAAATVTVAPTAPETLYFSPVWLTFADDVAPIRLEATEREALRVADAVVPLVVIAAFLVAVLAEHASPDPRRHHSNNPVGLALLVASCAASVVHVAALSAAGGHLPLAAATALKVVPLALAGYALVLLQCQYAQPRVAFVLTAGFLCRFDVAVPWLLQLFFVVASTIVPLMVFTASREPVVVRLVVAFVVIPLLSVVHRYFTVRTACAHTVAGIIAANNIARVGEQWAALDTLLGGLVPRHAVANVILRASTTAKRGPTGIQHWRQLSLLQIKLHAGGQDLQSIWAGIDAALHAPGDDGLLELLQANGDTLLIGGPFVVGADDATHVAAARQVLTLLRAFEAFLRPTECTFTAVATCGAAYGALLGAGGLTYRCFGHAVRESDAIMAAAPVPIGKRRSVAFASSSFRRQERNFAVPKQLAIHDASMSAALAASKEGPASTTPEGASAAFGAEMMWRAAGMGSAAVTVINVS
jgi:hypothetical protein